MKIFYALLNFFVGFSGVGE